MVVYPYINTNTNTWLPWTCSCLIYARMPTKVYQAVWMFSLCIFHVSMFRDESIMLFFSPTFFPAILFKSTYYAQFFLKFANFAHSIPSLQTYLCVLLEYFVTTDCSIRVYQFFLIISCSNTVFGRFIWASQSLLCQICSNTVS